jgi:phospholipid/cholesterol/gamma-HCH transport system permease protein
MVDFVTGIFKAGVFGLILGLIACTNGLRVTGGAAGVGRATTATVVQTTVAIVIADLLFSTIFYSIGLN